jgi:hypothetical protein
MGGYIPGSPGSDPTAATLGGVYFALNGASPVIDKSPYIYNVTTFGAGATGSVVDGSLHASGNRSMLFHTVTHIHSDGLGIWAKDNANAEIISGFTYYCQIGYTATGGSKIRSLNSSNSYGEFGVFSKGFDSSETANQGLVKGIMLSYQGTITGTFVNGELITGAGGATAYVINVQSEPKVLYIIPASGTFQSGEVVTGAGGATATLVGGAVTSNQSGRILVTTFSSSADPGDSLQFATTDGNAYQIQSVSSVTANSVAYHVLVFSTSRATPVADGVTVNVRKEYSQVRLTGHDFLNVGTGGTDTTNWPNSPTQNKTQANQVVTLPTDPGRVYYVATDEDGNFYVGDQFKVEQATGQVTLDSSAFDLSGLESLQLGSIGGLIGASVNEFSTDGTMSQNSNTKVPTQAAIRTYINSANHNFSGDVTFSGTTTTIDSATLSVEDKNIGIGSVTTPTNTTAGGGGLTLFGGADGDKEFKWLNAGSNPHYWSLTGGYLYAGEGLNTRKMLREGVNVGGAALNSASTLDLELGMVHYRTANLGAAITPNIRYDASTTLNAAMNGSEGLTVTIITAVNNAAYYVNGLSIDGSSQTVNWVGGSAPSDGGTSGVDIYTFNIIKTANTTFTVIGNQTKTS